MTRDKTFCNQDPDWHSSRRSALPERGMNARLAKIFDSYNGLLENRSFILLMKKLIASPIGLRKIKQARKEKGWNLNDSRWLESASEVLGVCWQQEGFAAGISYGTWKRFLGGKHLINDRAFQAYCQVLGLDWQSLIETQNTAQDWGEAIDVSLFFGRQEEIITLQKWLIGDRCSSISLLGMGGIGKTALAIKTAQSVQDRFDFVIWRSLRNVPSLASLLAEIIQFISNKKETNLPEELTKKISLLLKYLQDNKCLLILDNAESILEKKQLQNDFYYRPDYVEFAQFFQAIGDTQHQSCLLVTSREQIPELAILKENSLNRCLILKGLPPAEIKEIFQTKGNFIGSAVDWQVLIDRYGGNPLALKIVASYIKDFFVGNLAEFLAVLQQGLFIFDDIRLLLEQQFQRLNDLEQQIMYWLAIERQPVTLTKLQKNSVTQILSNDLNAALTNLQNRSLIETNSNKFTQQPVVMEYAIAELIARISAEIITGKIKLFNSHALIQAQAPEYIRGSQLFLILQPLTKQLLFTCDTNQEIGNYLKQNLVTWKKKAIKGYFAGNTINLLRQLAIDLSDYDFSGLTVWQANLQSLKLHRVNFSHCDLSRSIFTETLGNILSAAFSPQGNKFATCDNENKVRLWDRVTGKLLAICHGHHNWIRCIAFSPDGQTIVSGSGDRQIKLWNSNTGECLQTFLGHQEEIYSVAFSPDGKLIASGSADCTIKLWDLATAQCLQTLTSHQQEVRSVAFSPQGAIIASGSADCTIKLWDLATAQCLQTLTEHQNGVRSIAFSPDGRAIASGSTDCTIKFWDVTTGQCSKTYQGHSSTVYSLAFSPQGEIIASGSGDTTIRIWDTTTDRCLKTLYGHTNEIVTVDFGADEKTIVCASLDRTVKLWDITTGQCLRHVEGHTDWAFPVAFAPISPLTPPLLKVAGKILASISSDYQVRLWDTHTGECIQTLSGHQDHIWSVAFSPDGKILASGGADRQIRLWDLEKGKCDRILVGHEDWLRAIAFNPDGQTLISSGADDTIRVWNLTTGKFQTINAPQVWSISLSKDGKLLVTGSTDRTVKLWNLETRKCLQTYSTTDCQAVYSVAFSPDEKTIISGSADYKIRLWEINTKECLQVFSGHQGFVFALVCNLNGILASASGDRTVKLWDIQTGKCLYTLTGHTNKVCSLAFSADGQILASGSQDQSIRLWDVSTGKYLKTLRIPRLYEAMKITQASGLTLAQQETLQILGAISET